MKYLIGLIIICLSIMSPESLMAQGTNTAKPESSHCENFWYLKDIINPESTAGSYMEYYSSCKLGSNKYVNITIKKFQNGKIAVRVSYGITYKFSIWCDIVSGDLYPRWSAYKNDLLAGDKDSIKDWIDTTQAKTVDELLGKADTMLKNCPLIEARDYRERLTTLD